MIVMGRTTYDQFLTFGEYPYGGKKVFVLSQSRAGQRDEHVTFVGQDIVVKIRGFRAGIGDEKRSGLLAKRKLIRLFVSERLIDEIIVSLLPVIPGSGISPSFCHRNQRHGSISMAAYLFRAGLCS